MGPCVEWTGAFDRYGYSKMPGGRLAHRAVYEREVGAILEGWTVDHTRRHKDVHRESA